MSNENKKIPVDQIKQLANDIRLIQDFAENHNFDASLIEASVSPSGSKKKVFGFPFICMIGSIILLLAVLSGIVFIDDLSNKMHLFLIAVCLLLGTLATMSAHIEYHEKFVSIALAIGLAIAVIIGSGVLTPKEVIEKVEAMQK